MLVGAFFSNNKFNFAAGIPPYRGGRLAIVGCLQVLERMFDPAFRLESKFKR
jgi:hypothetical protein